MSDARLRRPPQPSADEIELIEAFAPVPRRWPARLVIVVGALLALAVLVAIVLSVFVVSEESTRPALTPAPTSAMMTPTPALTTRTPTTPALTTQPSAEASPPPAVTAPPESLAPLPPVTATAETISTAPAPLPAQPPDASGTGVRQRLHDLFPRLFPDGGN